MGETRKIAGDLDWAALIGARNELNRSMQRSHRLCEELEQRIREVRSQLARLRILGTSRLGQT